MRGYNQYMPQAQADWDAIRMEYVQGTDEITLASLSKKYETGFGTIQTHSRIGGWLRQRIEFRAEAYERVRKEALKRHVDLRVKLLDHQAALISAALKDLYDPSTGQIKGKKADLADLDRLLNTYLKFLAAETGEGGPDYSTKINIHLTQAVVNAGAHGAAEGLFDRVNRLREKGADHIHREPSTPTDEKPGQNGNGGLPNGH